MPGIRSALSVLLGSLAVMVCASPTAAVTVDGQNIPGEFGPPLAVQSTYTAFGDALPTGGSEADQLYVTADSTYLYVGVTGNLEPNGNAMILLLDTDLTPGIGQNFLLGIAGGSLNEPPYCYGLSGPPFAVQGLEATFFDLEFEPDYALAVDTAGALHVNLYHFLNTEVLDPCSLEPVTATRTFIGRTGPNTGDGTLYQDIGGSNPNGLKAAFDMRNILGVDATSADNAATASSGLEAAIPWADLGLAVKPAQIRIMVMITGGGGYESNQTLPGLPPGTPNLGDGPNDYALWEGNQFATVTFGADRTIPSIDGQNIPADFGPASLVATQTCATGFGDQSSPAAGPNGSEADALFARRAGDALLLGITGNLATNGHKYVLLFDTIPGGDAPQLADNAGPNGLTGLNGTTLDDGFAPDYALTVNAFGGTVYVNLGDLQLNTDNYLGANAPNSGAGTLEGGNNPNNLELALDTQNVLGVSSVGGQDPEPQATHARTATTGLEARIPLADIGLPADFVGPVRLLVLLVGENDDAWVSNHIFPPLPGPAAMLGSQPDLTAVPDEQFLTVELCGSVAQDGDADGDVDVNDFATFQVCFNGPGNPWPAELPPDLQARCACMDQDDDQDVDVNDFAVFQTCFNGSGSPPACGG